MDQGVLWLLNSWAYIFTIALRLNALIVASPEAIPGSSSNLAAVAQIHYADAGCDQGLACPPYENRKILSCTVYTK